MTKTRGLTLGKYAPLHKGHQLVIETALREMDEVVAIIYDCPDTTNVPLTLRANWIRDLYPNVQVVEAWDGPLEVGHTAEIKRKHEDYIIKQLKLTDITHFYSSEFYGDHLSYALGAVNRLVDPSRTIVPVSATEVRQDPFSFRSYLDPRVYRDLISNIVFLGAPSTGKTTIAERVAREYRTVWMPEYGREYWDEHQIDRRLSLSQLEDLAEKHLQHEDELLSQANRFLFTDTNALTTLIFARYYHNSTTPRLEELATRASARYDLVFVCDVDIPYDDTWDRSGKSNRDVFQKQIIADLLVRKIPFFTLRGDLETRTAHVKAIVDRYQKFTNFLVTARDE
jgi:HTH-type transcriptional regulator, transcriptional repressor of NAD biosynthesis genes